MYRQLTTKMSYLRVRHSFVKQCDNESHVTEQGFNNCFLKYLPSTFENKEMWARWKENFLNVVYVLYVLDCKLF